MIGVRRKKDEEAEKDICTQNRAVLVGFRAAYVFDVFVIPTAVEGSAVLQPASDANRSPTLPFVTPTEVEGSAVLSTGI
jgi:hypothetical protein